MPSNTVNCLYQDSIGYLWVGTDAGIGIFDGTDFKIINKKDGLASNDVRAITQDEYGNFWFACFDGGLTKYDGKTFTSFTTKDGFHSNFIRRLYYSKTYKTLFIGADDGFYTLKNGSFEFFGKANGKLEEEHEILWFLEGDGFVYVFPFKDNVKKFYPTTSEIKNLTDDGYGKFHLRSVTSALVTQAHDTIWGNKFAVSSSDGVRKIQPPKGALVFDMCENNNGDVWFPLWSSEARGILQFDGQVVSDYSTAFGLSNVRCNTVLFDNNSGVLWIGTDGEGLMAVPKQIFAYFSTDGLIKGNNDLRRLFLHQGTICMLLKEAIVKFNPDGKSQIIPIDILDRSEAGNLIRDIRRIRKNNLHIPTNNLWRFPELYDVAKDTQGNVWLSTTVGFYRLSDNLSRVTKALTPDIRYGQIEFDHLDNLYNWGYWQDTLDVIPDPSTQTIPYKYQHYSKDNVTLPKEASQMLPIGSNMLFSSVYGGLYLYDDTNFIHLNQANPSLPDNVSDICLDHQGDVVFITNTGEIGIGSIDNNQFKIKRLYDSLDQSYGRNFLWVICDSSYNIYVGTNRGLLVCHNPPQTSSKARDIRFYSNTEGYADFGVFSPILDDDGNVWLASQDNLIRIDSKAITSLSRTNSEIVLTRLETTDSTFVFDEESCAFGDQPVNGSWTFPFQSNNFTFLYNNVNLLNPEKDRFSVQLEGFDKAFRNVGADRKAVYTNLPAGNYKFVVRLFNLSTLNRQEKTLIEFAIHPPYWQAWWFYVILSIIVVALVLVINYIRLRQVKRSTQIKLEMAGLEAQALQSQMNPHFVFNVFNSLQRYILERDADKGIKLLSDFSNMIRQTFSLASKKFISLQDEITYLESYLKLEQERFAQKFKFEIIADPALNLTEIMIPSMLIQPMVENAVKHGLQPLKGTNGFLSVRFSRQYKNLLKCTIEDNGIGLERSLAAKKDSKTSLSKALSITQRRIELLAGSTRSSRYSVTVTDRSKLQADQKGTVVEIVLPIDSI